MSFDWNGLLYKRIGSLQEAVGDMLIQKLKFKPVEHVIDVGCGIGNLSEKIARQCRKGHVIAIDASETMIAEAIKRSKRSKNLTFQILSVEDMQFEKEFDVVYSNSVFHWVHDSSRVFTAFHRALKPTGRIGLQFPLLNDCHPLVIQMNELIDRLNYWPFFAEWKFPWFVTNARDLATEMELAGFKDVIVEQIKTKHVYDNISKVYDFYDAVGLECYLEPLREQHKETLKKNLIKELSSKCRQRTIELEIERIYAFGKA